MLLPAHDSHCYWEGPVRNHVKHPGSSFDMEQARHMLQQAACPGVQGQVPSIVATGWEDFRCLHLQSRDHLLCQHAKHVHGQPCALEHCREPGMVLLRGSATAQPVLNGSHACCAFPG